MRSICSGLSCLVVGAMVAACSPSGAAPAAALDAPEPTTAAPTLSESRAVSAAEEADEMRNAASALEFPQAFRGKWDYERAGCDRAESTTGFTISDKVIKGYEGQETLLTIRQISRDEIRVTLHLESAAGEDTYDQVMILSPVEGISMRIETEEGKSVRAYRCDPV